jgi:triacylglycerol esterase/lipase EstA (alpha/beta hydrolase family)
VRRGGGLTFNPRFANRAALALEGLLIGGLMLLALHHDSSRLAVVALALPIVGRAAYAACLTLLARAISSTPEATPVLTSTWAGLVWRGGVAILRNQIGMAFPAQIPRTAAPTGATIVALVPGYGCNAGCFGRLPGQLRANGLTCVAFEPSNALGSLEASADEAALWLHEIARAAPGTPIVLVGISMGGLVARLATQRAAAPRIAHLVTISSPHHGTWMARFGVGAASRDMKIGSAVLEQMRAQPLACPTTAIWTPDDAIIVPPESAKIDGAEMVAVPFFTHLAIAEAPEVAAAIIRAAACLVHLDL